MNYYGIPLVDEFLYDKFSQGLSPLTLRDYRTMFNLILESSIFSFSDLSTFSELNIKIFLGDLLQKRNWTSQTYNRVKKNMKVFFDFLVLKGVVSVNPLKNISNRKVDKLLPKSLNSNKVRLLRRFLQVFGNSSFVKVRDKTILYMYLYTGIRLSELLNLKIEDINYLEKYITIRKGKGGKDRLVPIIHPFSQILLDYYFFRVRSAISSEYLFPTLYGNILTSREVYKFVHHVSDCLGFKITPHMFRHTFATELVRKNINLYDVSQVLGHSNINTTKIYLSLDIDNVRNKISIANLYN